MKLQTQTLEELRVAASKILAAAVLEIFPETQLVSARLSPHGFCADFIFPFSFTQGQLTQVEERMGQIAREKREVKILEMVPVSAAGYFAHKNQAILAARAEESGQPILTLFQMGEFLDECPENFSISDTSVLKFFRLFEFSEEQRYEGKLVTRISGSAFFIKEDLKEFLKKWDSFAQKDHLFLGKELDLFSLQNEKFLWHPRGESLRKLLCDFWREELSKKNFKFLSTQDLGTDLTANHSKFFRKEEVTSLAEFIWSESLPVDGWERGLLTVEKGLIDRAHIFCRSEQLLENSISSLHFLNEILKILLFKFRFVLCSFREEKTEGTTLLEEALRILGVPYTVEQSSSRVEGLTIELRIQDGIGKEWRGPFVGLDSRFPQTVVFSLFNPLERLIALLLENAQGELPLWLTPEQVRIVAVKEVDYATEVAERFQAAGIRTSVDKRGDKLAKRLHEALKVKIPWFVLIGEKEKKNQCITVRSFSSTDAEEMSVEDFIQKNLNRKS